MNELIAIGAAFDREATGDLSLAREGGHSRPRVVHAGGAATGAEVERALVEATRASAGAVLERWFALDLLVEGGRCRGVLARPPSGGPVEIEAAHMLLATGGVGPAVRGHHQPPRGHRRRCGDGAAGRGRRWPTSSSCSSIRPRCTTRRCPGRSSPRRCAATGRVLRDGRGEHFVDELAPRDVVSRAMAERMAAEGTDHLWLDATGLEHFDVRFPTIAASLARSGSTRRWTGCRSPRPPTTCRAGWSPTSTGPPRCPGLWAAGETACTGVHGANRLASNSLLEGMVFGARVAEAVLAGVDGPRGDRGHAGRAGRAPTSRSPAGRSPSPVAARPRCGCPGRAPTRGEIGQGPRAGCSPP